MSSPPPSKRSESPSSAEPAKKRRRGAARLSCAECRRLKLRCDRNIPCGSCVKRGCGAICPDGSLTTGQGNRFVLASTQELHEKIAELCARVRELEDGLRTSHAKYSSEEHPLLSEELLRIKAPLQREVPIRDSVVVDEKEDDLNPDVVDSFGTLRIARTGFTNYHAQSANSWYFLQNEDDEEDASSDNILQQLKSLLPEDILRVAASIPVTPCSRSLNAVYGDRLRNLHWYLPSPARASELRDTFFSYASWLHVPISLTDFNDIIFTPIYNALPSAPPEVITLAPYAHRLSLLFTVLAIGCLMDTRLPAYNIEAEKYNQLGRAALFQSSVFDDESTVEAVQALLMMSFYLFLADRHGSRAGSRWAMTGLAVKLAQSIGLHRDTNRWKVDASETMRRRALFWELYVFDSWQCLTFGRPPSFMLTQIDCKMPHTREPSVEETFHAWKHRFSSECMTTVHDQAFGAKTPTYATILQLDRKLRAITVPPVLQIVGFGNAPPADSRANSYPETVSLILQRHIVLAIREINLLYMHRSFFARALSDHPRDPLGSQYGSSVIAAYRSAGALIALVRNLHSQLKDVAERLWFLWTHMFSCAIVLGSIVTRSPSLSLAPSALVQLDSACELFAKAARGFRAEKILARLMSLREKAHASINNYREGKITPPPSSGSDSGLGCADDNEDDLSMLGGKTRLVSKHTVPTSSVATLIDQSQLSIHPVIPFPIKNLEEPMHPSVVEYLKSFSPAPSFGVTPPASLHTLGSEARMPSTANSAAQHKNIFDFAMDSSAPGTSAYPSPATSSSYHGSIPQTPASMLSLGALDVPFPSYFPVFDYSSSTGAQMSQSLFSPVDTPGIDGHHRSRSIDSSHSTSGSWQDFVTQLGIA